MDEAEIKKHFKKVDPIIYVAFQDVDFSRWYHLPIEQELYFHTLANQIISQQLNTKVADIISERLSNLVEEKVLTPKSILKLNDDELRSVGLSKSKSSYIKNLAQLTLDKQINYDSFTTASEEEIIDELIKVKGIGRWTAEMFLMFALAKQDVFSHGDYGLRSGMKKLYNLAAQPTLEEAIVITNKWQPYRSFGSFALWQSLEKKE